MKPGPKPKPLEERYRVDEDGCWIWTGQYTNKGYGDFQNLDGRKHALAHRASYEHFKGPIPEGLVIDHLCRVRGCVNPDHLEAVTQSENLRRGMRGNKTQCHRGHAWVPENMYIAPGTGKRSCYPCRLQRAREQHERRRQARLEGQEIG